MIPALNNYHDYINLYFFYFDPNVMHIDKQHQFSLDKDIVKLLPYFTINRNGSFLEILEESYFTNNALSNIMILDMIQNPYIDNVVQSNLFDHHLLYMVNSYEEHNSYLALKKHPDCKFFNNFSYKTSFSTHHSPYYKAYSNQNNADLINQKFATNLENYLNLFKMAFDDIRDMEFLEEQLGSKLSSVFYTFSSLLESEIKSNNVSMLSQKILKGFNTNRVFLNKAFNDLDAINSPIFEKLHEGYLAVQEYNDNQINNLTEAKKRLNDYPQDHDDYFNKLTLFLEIGASLILNSEKFLKKQIFSPDDKKFISNFIDEYKFLLYQTDFHCLKTFVDLFSPIIADPTDLNERKKEFVTKYSQSIQNIESIYNKYDVSLFHNENYLDDTSFKKILPEVLIEIDNILISCESFYSFKNELDEKNLQAFKDVFKNNFFISLCQNKVTPDIYENLHLNYPSIMREITLNNKLSPKNTPTKHRHKI